MLEKNTGLICGDHTSCLYLQYPCHWNLLDCFLGNINGECSCISLGLQKCDNQWGREIKLQRFAPSLKWLAQRWLMSLQLIAHCANSQVALNTHPQFFAKHRCKVDFSLFLATVVVVLHWRHLKNKHCIRIYSLYRERIHSDISDYLYCTLFTLHPSSLPLNLLLTPLKAIARGFFVLFHIGIWSPSVIHCHLNLLPSPSPL
jgi:hypothetical protein